MSSPDSITLDEHGRFSRAGKPLVPVGANYWPASCGVEMWPRWPAEEMRHDLDTLAALGLNCVRFFLRWQDFEPEPGRYDEAMFERLGEFLDWCAARGVLAHPSLFVGFMSGGIFWPAWRERRNIFADPLMIGRAVEFARRAADVIALRAGAVLAVDLGNELVCLPDSAEACPAAVMEWCGAVSGAVRSVAPRMLIVSGNEQNQFVSDRGWRFGAQPGTDFYSMHGYPVPAWHPVGFDGMTDPFGQSLLPFYTKIARAFGPVMLQEFGTLLTFGAAQQRQYLRAVLPACREAGANGYLWWCLRDITARHLPYRTHGNEGALGLVDDRDRIKPGLEYFLEFARAVQTGDAAGPRDGSSGLGREIGLYWPRHFYSRDNPANAGNDPRWLSRWMSVAQYLLGRAGCRVRIVRGDRPLDGSLRTLLVAGAFPDLDETAALAEWAGGGGRLVWHGPDSRNWGQDYVRLFGARPVDYRANRAVKITLFGQPWAFAHYPRGLRYELAPESATVLARDEDGLAVALRNAVGRGAVVYATAHVEESVARVADRRGSRDRWTAWYAGMLEAVR
jgi:hypothetical protein